MTASGGGFKLSANDYSDSKRSADNIAELARNPDTARVVNRQCLQVGMGTTKTFVGLILSPDVYAPRSLAR
jgi:hypothetical protein